MILGTERLYRKLARLPVAAQQRIGDALEAGASELHGHAVRKIQASGSAGRSYRRGTHVASAPGAFPNTDTGELVRSMGWLATSALSSVFYVRAKHARPLELGTSKMAARPFMRPTLKELRPRIQARVDAAIREAMKAVASGR